MNEERIYEDVAVEETVAEESLSQVQVQEPVVAKKGLATAALVFGILAFITTLLLINYVFGILALVFGIIYLAKKADVKPKGKAITGVVLASLSLIISTTILVSAYVYFMKTDMAQIITDVGALIGEEIDGEEFLNQTVEEMTGGAVDMDTIEQFVGGEVTMERVVDFIGDVQEADINAFAERINNMDEETIQKIAEEFSGEITYEKLEEKLGKDFDLRKLMEYIEGFENPQ